MNETKNKTDEFLYSIWNFFAASLSEKTRKNYYNVIKAYVKITGHSPLELTESDTEKYFNDLTEKIQKQKIIIFNGTDAYVCNAYVMRIYTCT